MQKHLTITEKENKGLKRAYEVVVAKDAINARTEAELKKVGAKAKIDGFRPGHVPAAILKQRYGSSVMGEVIEKTVNEAALEVAKSKDERPAMQPKVEIKKYEDGGDLTFAIEYELLPKTPKVDFSKISLNKQVAELGDEAVNESLERIAASNKSRKPKAKTAKAKTGDVVKIDFKGFLGDEAFPGGEGKDFDLELGSGQFIPGFEEQLEGTKAGDEVEVKVSFPEEYHSEDLAGKESRFEVTVHEVLETAPAEIDDELAKTLGLESLEKLKEAVRGQLEGDYNSISRSKLKKALFDELDEAAKFEVPEGLVTLEFDSIWNQYEEARNRGEIQEDRDADELKAEYRTIAERRVRLGIFLSNVASENKLEVSKEELTGAIFAQARNYPEQSQQIFEFYQKNPEHLQELRGPILEEKAVDLILEEANVTETTVSVEELIAEEEEAEKPKAKKKAAPKKAAAKADAEKPAAKKTAPKKKAAPKKAAS